MAKRARVWIGVALIPVLLSGCIVAPLWDDGYGYRGGHGGHHHGGHGYGDRRGGRW